jgi:hypothetical protein
MKQWKAVLIWLTIVVSAGAIGAYFFQLNFFAVSAIAVVALWANALIADWEDRDDK